ARVAEFCRVQAAMLVAADRETRAQGQLVDCVFGNPGAFPAPIEAALLAWDGGVIPRLAQAAHDARQLPAGTLDAARLAVIADALEEAGLTDAALLAHLRSPGPHVRGCHAVDWVLGRD